MMILHQRVLQNCLPVLIFLTGLLTATAQNITSPFERLEVSENFDSAGAAWSVVSNAENLFIIQDGQYFLQRKATSAPYAIVASLEKEFSEYRLVVSLKIEKLMSEEAHLGILFMMQPQGQGGFLLEINKSKEYRLRQIVGGSYRYLSGSSKGSGWTRHSSVNEAGVQNILEVRTTAGTYDLYINNIYVRSFNEPNYRSGKLGLIIGPESRGQVDSYYVFTQGSATQVAEHTGEHPVQTGDVAELAQSIITLKSKINELEETNEGLRRTISALQTGDQEKEVISRNQEKQMAALQQQIKARDITIDSLHKANATLNRYKEIVGDKDQGDIVINLSRALKTEKEKNQKLEEELKQLKDKQGAPKSSGNPDPKNETGDGNRSTPPKDPNVFSLPR